MTALVETGEFIDEVAIDEALRSATTKDAGRVREILAKAGIASRRKAEELITLGEVTINGQVAKLGDQAEWGVDAVKVTGLAVTMPCPATTTSAPVPVRLGVVLAKSATASA